MACKVPRCCNEVPNPLLGWFRFMDNKENINENSLFKIQQQLVET